jgi:hypothetical protein
MMFLGGGWIAFHCAANLFDFIDTGMITWGRSWPPLPVSTSYATQPVVAIVAVVITALVGLMGACGVVVGLTDFRKILSSWSVQRNSIVNLLRVSQTYVGIGTLRYRWWG